jgi:SmpA / OmlA family
MKLLVYEVSNCAKRRSFPMSLFENLVMAIAILGLSIATYFYSFSESVFAPNPLIDTQLPKGFSVEQFEQIKPGMTRQQVRQLVPEPPLADQSVWQYGNDGAAPFGDFAWFWFEIEFDQAGRVIKTSRRTFYD